MKVLFAVSNENIVTQIVKQYQKEYKEIISYKNMYYFNAIVKELQRDKSYDRIVISEELEPFANNNYDAIDKFIFEKLDNISDEATGLNGEDIPIILIATDRREKSEPILVKLFGIGIYNTLLGKDRSTTNVCTLLNKPRGKKEAKVYYKIEADEVNYKSESEENVSEIEINNILNHYRKLGKDEDRYIESFNNIAAQYNDGQLRIITKFLPLNVKAVLEEKCPKYQAVMTFGDTAATINAIKKQKEDEGLKIGFLESNQSSRPTKPVIVPTAVKKVGSKKIVDDKPEEKVISSIVNNFEDDEPIGITEKTEENEVNIEPAKRGRGRPSKKVVPVEKQEENIIKPVARRGRPRKVEEPKQIESTDSILPGFDELEESNLLPGFDKPEEEKPLPGFDKPEEENSLPGFDEIEDTIVQSFNKEQEENVLPGFDDETKNEISIPKVENRNVIEEVTKVNSNLNNSIVDYNSLPKNNLNNVARLLTKDRKIVSFVGTTKNGTSFLVNNVAKILSDMGIKTAIIDLTKNRNSYYIYTQNDEQLRNIAYESIKKLRSGITQGIHVNKNLDIYTALPGDKLPLEDVDNIISTLVQNYSAVIMDCDFNTPEEYFGISQEIYVVQTMDILTIQPMTAFLRDLKAKDILKQEKIKIVVNKELKVKGLNSKVIVGGLAYYNDPAMSFMTELFNKDIVEYCEIPFDVAVYAKYLEEITDCEISTNGYSKMFNDRLRGLASLVYPLLTKGNMPVNYSNDYRFSNNMNNTLEQMKKKY